MNFLALLKFLAARAKEPSTLAAVSAMGLLFGLPPGTVELGAQIVGGVAGLAAVLVPEKATQ